METPKTLPRRSPGQGPDSLLGPDRQAKIAPLRKLFREARKAQKFAENRSYYTLLPIQDYARQSSGLLTLNGIITKMTVLHLPSTVRVGFMLGFYPTKPENSFRLYFTASENPDEAIASNDIIASPGWKVVFFEVAALNVVSGGSHAFELDMNGKIVTRFPLTVSTPSWK